MLSQKALNEHEANHFPPMKSTVEQWTGKGEM
jgi:hypothetical protein